MSVRSHFHNTADTILLDGDAKAQKKARISDDIYGRVRMWRGGLRFSLSVAAPFVWRCLNSHTITPFPHPPHRTGQADFLHPALGQELTPSHTKGHP